RLVRFTISAKRPIARIAIGPPILTSENCTSSSDSARIQSDSANAPTNQPLPILHAASPRLWRAAPPVCDAITRSIPSSHGTAQPIGRWSESLSMTNETDKRSSNDEQSAAAVQEL